MDFLDRQLHDNVLQLVCTFPAAWGGCLKVVWQVLVAEMAAGPPCSGCFVYLWRKKCLNHLLLRKLRHQDNLPAHTYGAPSSLHPGQSEPVAAARRCRCCCRTVRNSHFQIL